MNPAPDKRIYKVTSLFIKAAILILSFIYIFHKFQTNAEKFDLILILANSDKELLILSFCILFLNWGIEAFKWQYLISALEKISFKLSLQSVFAGVTVSIFMPNRVGEFAGRIFFLESADKVGAALKNLISSMIQLLVTVLAGITAIFIAVRQDYINTLTGLISQSVLNLSLFILVFILILSLVLNKFRAKFSQQVQAYFSTVFDTPANIIVITLLLSVFRYLVFLFQYYLVLKAFGISPGMQITFILIAITFLITSIVPSFALTEIATRGAVAGYLFGHFTNDIPSVIAASFTVWIINLAIPALIGSFFIRKLKFIKAQ